ncbi:MAG TPA: sulfotransferase family 2 domain-containing protein [Longimicrobium sp.]|nr:sulfotransferase family 2 domain-containing protein [Longimicrobium sp.]
MRAERPARLIAFSHVPKTAGLTLNLLLRRHFGARHVDVVYRDASLAYTPRDLAFDLRLHPFARSLAGHSLKPYVDFGRFAARLDWYTFLRDPVKRFVSHYQHEVEKGGKTLPLAEWMRTFRRSNWQVRMLAGSEDVAAARQILDERMRFVGLQEHFDAGLLVMRRRLGLDGFRVGYGRPVNTARSTDLRDRIMDEVAKHRAEVEGQNALDMELYRHAVDVIWPRQVAEYGAEALRGDLAHEFADTAETPAEGRRRLANRIYRNVVYKPVARLGRLARR